MKHLIAILLIPLVAGQAPSLTEATEVVEPHSIISLPSFAEIRDEFNNKYEAGMESLPKLPELPNLPDFQKLSEQQEAVNNALSQMMKSPLDLWNEYGKYGITIAVIVAGAYLITSMIALITNTKMRIFNLANDFMRSNFDLFRQTDLPTAEGAERMLTEAVYSAIDRLSQLNTFE